MSRTILGRLIALALITLIGLYYIIFSALHFKLPWDQPYHIKADLPAAGGLYQDAEVTFRGLQIGKVSSVQLRPNMVVAELAIDKGKKIPADVYACVRELTAAGEQYLDLVRTPCTTPQAVGEPNKTTLTNVGYMSPGHEIPLGRTGIPVSVGVLLNTVNALVNSLSATDLNTISQNLATGLGGAGQDLRSIIVDGRTLLQALQQSTPGTVQLITSGNTILNTFNKTSDAFSSFASSLRILSGQLVQSNSDLVALLQNGSAGATALNNYLKSTASPTVSLLTNLETISGLAYQRLPAAQILFQILPVLAQNLAATSSGGQLHFELTFNTKNTVCPYVPVIPEPTTLVATADLTRDCATTAADLLQRGADTAPTP